MEKNPEEETSKVATPEPEEKDEEEEEQKDEVVDNPVPDTEESGEKVAKKRTWRKPKDKPKRPLSAYNIFFQHARSRIVQGHVEEATPEEIVRSIEAILSKSREKRRHRKSHGRISFGDLARAIADQWKGINPKHKEIFDHYAEVDMIRYRREVKVWKDKKEMETEANTMAKHNNFINSMSNSFNSAASSSENFLDSLPDEGSSSDSRAMHESFNSSYSSPGDASPSGKRRMHSDTMSLMIQRQQQILRQQLREENRDFMSTTLGRSSGQTRSTLPGSQAFHQSFSSIPSGFDMQPVPEAQQSQTMQQLKMQQELQLEQMRQLQLKQRQLQQQIQMQQLQAKMLQQQGGGMNMGHSSFSDIRSSSFMNQMPNQTPSFGNNAMNESLNLGDALQAPSVHVSDYSNSATGHSSGFASSSHSFGMGSYSDGFHGGDVQLQRQVNFMQQQNSSLNGPFSMGMQQRGGDSGFVNNFSGNADGQHQEHDLRTMDMDV